MRMKGLTLLCFVAFPLFGQQIPVKVILDAPTSVVAGNDFEVTLKIYKGELQDYSRFSQDVPSGFTAEKVQTPNADFTFTDQRVRIIWLKLPPDNEITVKYLINVDERLSGILELYGTFAYVDNGERKYVEINDPVKVQLLPNPNVDPEKIVDISQFNTIKTPVNIEYPDENPINTDNSAEVLRQKPYVESNGTVFVTLLVKKPQGSDYLKLEESIPGGYTFQAITKNDAVVSQSASLARFVWMKSPSESSFIVKYSLSPIQNRQQEDLVIDGNLTYNEYGETKIASVKETEANIDAMTSKQRNEFLTTGTISPNPEDKITEPEILQENIISPETDEPLTTSNQTNTTQNNPDATIQTNQTNTAQNNPDATNQTNQTNTAQNNLNTLAQNNQTQEPEISGVENTLSTPEITNQRKVYKGYLSLTLPVIEHLKGNSGVYYRVQIAAVRHPYFDRVVFAEYDLFRDVKVERINGWSKYTVGPVYQLDMAIKLRDKIISQTPEDSAFIVAYINGNRVPLDQMQNTAEYLAMSRSSNSNSGKIDEAQINNSNLGSNETTSGLSLYENKSFEAGDGVYFRVQVAALRNPNYDREYFNKHRLLKDAKIENIGRWRKFTVGYLASYEEAAQLKDLINSEIPKSSAFIVAYKDDSRVPITDVMVR